VTAGKKEVVSGTDAVVISCKVTGLTVKLQTVQWKNSDGTDVKDTTGYTVDEGQYESGSQTTTLTVATARTTNDADYYCLITPTSPDATIEITTVVKLNVFSKFYLSGQWSLILNIERFILVT
jgi:hypothetical protein